MGWTAVLLLALAVVLTAVAIHTGGNARAEGTVNAAVVLAGGAVVSFAVGGLLGLLWLTA